MAPGSQMKLLLAAIAMSTCAAAAASSLASPLAAAAVVKNSPEDYVKNSPAGPVSWDAEAARHAAKRAATACTAGLPSRLPAGGGEGYGENIFRGTPGKAPAATATDALRAWTAPAAREYVQVVWPGSYRIGCAHAVCAGVRGVVVSCCYKPAVKEDLRGAPLPSYCRYNISRCYECPIC